MAQAEQAIVAEAQSGQRLDNFLMSRLKGVPKSRLYKAIRSGEVRVNGGRAKPTRRLCVGDRVRIPPIRIAEKKESMPPSTRWISAFQSRILCKSSSAMVINKPAGMPVHAGTGIERGLIENIKACDLYGPEWELVHRLDRATSGCLLLAKIGHPLMELQRLFKERIPQKRYLLWVHGRWDRGVDVVTHSLRKIKAGGEERRVIVCQDGMPAKTTFTPLLRYPDRSLLMADLETGRTHQIRVHAAACGHPVIGDSKYATAYPETTLVPAESGNRLFLHAASLVLPSPWSEMSICVQPDSIWSHLRIKEKPLY